MDKLNPYFEVDGKTYEIERTRYLECEYEKITSQSSLTAGEEKASANYLKMQSEYEEIAEQFRTAKSDYFADVLDKKKKAKYLAFKELVDEKYNELINFSVDNDNFSLKKLEDKAYENGLKLLYVALEQKYKLSHDEVIEIWDKFTEHFGLSVAKQWILAMVNELFGTEEETDPFLKQARAKAEQKAEQRKGLKKMKM